MRTRLRSARGAALVFVPFFVGACQALLTFETKREVIVVRDDAGEGGSSQADGAAADGDVVDAGGLDGAIDSPAEAGGFCTTFGAAHSFCADFDQGPVDAGWSDTSILGSATVEHVVGLGLSAPNAMRVSIAAVTTEVAGQLLLRKSGRPARQILSFSILRVATEPAWHLLAIFPVMTAGGEYRVELQLQNDNLFLLERGAIVASSSSGGPVPSDSWARILVDVDYIAKRGKVQINGTQVIDDMLETPPITGGQTGLDFGLYRGPAGSAQASQALFDDVLYDDIMQ